MIIDQRVVIQAPVDRVWEFTEDILSVGRCLPGVQAVEQLDQETYLGGIRVKVGPVDVQLEGKVRIVELDREALRARMDVEAADRRIQGAVNAKSTIQLEALEDGTTAASIHTDAAVLGKLGEFGQAVMRRKANQILQQFARNVGRTIAEREAERNGTAAPAAAAPAPDATAAAAATSAAAPASETPASDAVQTGGALTNGALTDGAVTDGAPASGVASNGTRPAPAVQVPRPAPAPAGMLDLNGVRLRNRLVTSASLLGYGASRHRFILYGLSPFAQWVPLERFGAVTTRTLTLQPREGHFTLQETWKPSEFPEMLRRYGKALQRVDAGWINAFGWSNIGIERYFAEYHPLTERLNRIVSVGGFSAEEFCALVEAVNRHAAPGEIAAVEFNVSCHNVNFPFDEILGEVLAQAVPRSRHPVIVKLSPDNDYVSAARVAQANGAAALTAINGTKALRLDPETGEPLLKNRYGTLTGRALKPVGLRVVAELRDAGITLPIIATAGIRTFDDCREYFWAGADAVSLGSSTWLAPMGAYALGPARGARIRRLIRKVAAYEPPRAARQGWGQPATSGQPATADPATADPAAGGGSA